VASEVGVVAGAAVEVPAEVDEDEVLATSLDELGGDDGSEHRGSLPPAAPRGQRGGRWQMTERLVGPAAV
jgi:hypothetical protein